MLCFSYFFSLVFLFFIFFACVCISITYSVYKKMEIKSLIISRNSEQKVPIFMLQKAEFFALWIKKIWMLSYLIVFVILKCEQYFRKCVFYFKCVHKIWTFLVMCEKRMFYFIVYILFPLLVLVKKDKKNKSFLSILAADPNWSSKLLKWGGDSIFIEIIKIIIYLHYSCEEFFSVRIEFFT